MKCFHTLEIITVFITGGVLILTFAAPISQRGNGIDRKGRRKYETEEDQKEYLWKYGHMRRKGDWSSVNEFRSAIRSFQHYGGLKPTGVMDNATKTLMELSRCGIPDRPVTQRRRRRFATLGSRWWKNNLKFRIQIYSAKLPPDVLTTTIQQAFQLWSAVVPLNFTQTFKASDADINIQFASFDHGDGFPFDGPGGVYGHTFPPADGRIHFDESESWTSGTRQGIDLRQVCTHEAGHSIGLGHSDNPRAIMYPFYPEFKPTITLDDDDIAGAQSIYGSTIEHEFDATTSFSTTTTTVKSSIRPTSPIMTTSTTKPLTTFFPLNANTPVAPFLRSTPPVSRKFTPPKV